MNQGTRNALSRTYWDICLPLDWRRKTPETAEAALAGIGLTERYWSLRAEPPAPTVVRLERF